MAISDLVQYERAFPLELKAPKTGKPVGVTFNVMHLDCQAATDVADRHALPAALGGSKAGSDRHLEIYAACIQSWDWGKHEFEEGKGIPELSIDTALHVFKKAPWIARQVMDIANDIGNFMDN